MAQKGDYKLVLCCSRVCSSCLASIRQGGQQLAHKYRHTIYPTNISIILTKQHISHDGLFQLSATEVQRFSDPAPRGLKVRVKRKVLLKPIDIAVSTVMKMDVPPRRHSVNMCANCFSEEIDM